METPLYVTIERAPLARWADILLEREH